MHPRSLILISFLFLWPILLSIAISTYLSWQRSDEAVEAIFRYATAGAEVSAELTKGRAPDLITERMDRYLADPRRHGPMDRDHIRKSMRMQCLLSLIYIDALSLLPFCFLWFGLRQRWLRLSRAGSPLRAHEALEGWWMRSVISFAVCTGWTYLFNPFGQGASAVYLYLKSQDMVSNNTYPILYDLTRSDIRHLLMAFLGWYIHSLVFFMLRAETSDVLGAKLYRVLFEKFLIVTGAAAALSSVSPDASLIAAFVIGVFPMNAISILRELTQKKFDTSAAEVDSLSILPDMSRSSIARLQEEGIDSLPALALADLDTIDRAIPDEVIPRRQLALWIDTARLISAVGVGKWEDLRWLCQTASEFVGAAQDPALHARLQTKIENVDFFAARLRQLYPAIVEPQRSVAAVTDAKT